MGLAQDHTVCGSKVMAMFIASVTGHTSHPLSVYWAKTCVLSLTCTKIGVLVLSCSPVVVEETKAKGRSEPWL